jgi:nitrite reductase/ring-hydroxylating ferredoxin subunit
MSAAPEDPGARCPGPGYRDLLEADSRPVPPALLETSGEDLGDAPLDASRWFSRAFFELEAERLWPRVWQMVCREEHLPEVGDTVVYDIVGRSVLVVRSAPDRLQAFHNACLHRGRKLRDCDGHAEQLRCPFHGFTWSLDGRLKSIPCRWDFEHLDGEDLSLPELRVDTWGGFVFVNMDPAATPLDEYLAPLPAHFARWAPEDCYLAAHVAQVIPCNWKVAQEAFMESYHVIATHPQILPVAADASSQYDTWGLHVNRNMMAFAATSPHLADAGIDEARVVKEMLAMWGKEPPADLDRGQVGNARTWLGDRLRGAFQHAWGGDYSGAADAEVLDALVYNVFPNFAPWGGFAPNIVYRWRPFEREVSRCIMEVMILKRVPEGGDRPPPATVHWLADDEPWSNAKELPVLGPVIDQDLANLPHMEAGLRSLARGQVQLGHYQERRIRHFHRTLDHYLALP